MNTSLTGFSAFALPGIPFIQPGDDLVTIILDSLKRAAIDLQPDDVLVIASKIVSKAEGRIVDLNSVEPGSEALRVAELTQKDPRVVELVLQESTHISRMAPGVLVVAHRLGFISANAGIDQSNVDGSANRVLLLPRDPDQSAGALRQRLWESTGTQVAVVISDTHGRPFRRGNVGVAIGVAGVQAVLDLRGNLDLFGRELKVTLQGYADLLASAAHLLCGEGAEGRPVILMRGLALPHGEGCAADLNRALEHDLYR